MWIILRAEWHKAVICKQMERCWRSIREVYCKCWCIWRISTVSCYDCDLRLKFLGYDAISYWALEKDILQVLMYLMYLGLLWILLFEYYCEY